MEMRDLYWLAGLLEGEASFSHVRYKNRKYPRIELEMADEDVILRVHRLMGCGSIAARTRIREGRSPQKTLFKTRAVGTSNTAGWLMTLYPLMSVRRQEQIRKLLLQWSNPEDP